MNTLLTLLCLVSSSLAGPTQWLFRGPPQKTISYQHSNTYEEVHNLTDCLAVSGADGIVSYGVARARIRVVPIFPELKPYLDAVWDALGDKRSEFVITRHRGANINLRTQFERILTRAGVKPWPKLFQNLRASRATELAGEFPPHVAAEWLGHSTLVAHKHYWQVTDSDFERAGGKVNKSVSPATKTRDAESDALIMDAKKEAIFAAMATDTEVAEIAATWANLSPTARQCMMALVRSNPPPRQHLSSWLNFPGIQARGLAVGTIRNSLATQIN
jgi:hypothetical protein